jgi:hypothetical protein
MARLKSCPDTKPKTKCPWLKPHFYALAFRGLKAPAPSVVMRVVARVKPCPDASCLPERVFSQPVKSCPVTKLENEMYTSGAEAHLHFSALAARLKSCPDTSRLSDRVFPLPVDSCPVTKLENERPVAKAAFLCACIQGLESPCSLRCDAACGTDEAVP